MKKVIVLVVLVLSMVALVACGNNDSKKSDQKNDGAPGLSLVEPEFNGETMSGPSLPITIHEDENEIVFYAMYGVFFYDIKSDKISKAFNVSGDDRFVLNRQGETGAEAYWDEKTSNIVIFDTRSPDTIKYHYVYDVKSEKLNKVDGNVGDDKLKMYDNDDRSAGWTRPYDDGQAPAKDLKYTSPVSGKEYYPLANYVGGKNK